MPLPPVPLHENDRQILPGLPALKGLGDLADARPTIIVDSREQAPLVFTRLPSVTGTLTTATVFCTPAPLPGRLRPSAPGHPPPHKESFKE